MKSPPKLSPTSYALLGLLDRNPASAYELNTIMQTSMLRVFWPRAESHVYSEPKKLLAHGLVSEQKGKANGRPRTVYTITAQGREALTGWLAEEDVAEHRSQAEFMLKLILASGGSATNAQATLQRALETSRREMEQAIAGIESILANPDHAAVGMPWNGISSNLMADFLVARHQWGLYAIEEANKVSDDSPETEKQELGLEGYRRALEKMRAAIGEV